MTRILITGKNGQVGWELQRTLMALGEVIAVDRGTVDLADPDSVRGCIREFRPQLIANAAAYTAVDKAESEPELAMAVNGVAPGVMAEEAKRLGAVLIHYSTDYVFDGSKDGAYTEEDATNPLSVYGKSKLAGERAIREIGCRHLILRTSWVYGTRGKNFLLTILRLAKERPELQIVDDQVGAPTWSRHIAEVTGYIVAQYYRPISDASVAPNEVSKADVSFDLNGVYHLTAGGHTSWFGFAKAIVDAQADNKTPLRVVPIATGQYPTKALRPMNSVLSNRRLIQRFGLTQPSWDACLKACLGQS